MLFAVRGNVVDKPIKVPKSRVELKSQLTTLLDAVRLNIDAYLNNKSAGWLAVSSQLYTLLVYPSWNSSLLGYLYPDTALYPLKYQIKRPQNSGDVSYLINSVGASFSGNTITIQLFDTNAPKMKLKKWLKQVINVSSHDNKGYYATIEDLIRYSRNQMGGGHLDKEWDAIAETLKYPEIRLDGETYPFYHWATILVGHVVESEARERIANDSSI